MLITWEYKWEWFLWVLDQGDLTKRLKVKKTFFFYMGALSHESKFKVLARTLGTSPNMLLG